MSARVPGGPGHYLIKDERQFFDEVTASSLLKARPDLAAVFHTHTTANIAVSSQKFGLLPLSQHAFRVRGRLGYHAFGVFEFSPEHTERPEHARAAPGALALPARKRGPMTAPLPAALDIRELSKRFHGRDGIARTVLERISVAIGRGEFICIVGASGSGKTTFIRAVGGLIEADSGQVLINGQSGRLPASRRAYVFQPATIRASCPAACANGSTWRGRWQWTPTCCSWTSRSPRWTRRRARPCSANCWTDRGRHGWAGPRVRDGRIGPVPPRMPDAIQNIVMSIAIVITSITPVVSHPNRRSQPRTAN